jgi:hypothetical protein
LISTPFLLALGFTVVALVAVLWSGVTRRRNIHYGMVVVMLGLLAWTIREAEIMGAELTYQGAASVFRTIHFVAVTATFLIFPVLTVTGVRLAREETAKHRKAHRTFALIFLLSVVATTALGTTMTLLASPAVESAVDAPQQ